VADHPRVDELRRRVQQDPASIAFAQLAEECRRLGELDEAVRLCRAGLTHHPAYLSAHVTLGRALMALGQNEEARTEFEQVLRAAPDNLVALRCLEELGPSSAAPASWSAAASVVEPSTDEQPALSDVEAREQQRPEAPRESEQSVPPPSDTVIEELDRLLAAIRSDRATRGSGDT
jgi:tetratricopeptide (TPR) repeat protein